MALKRTKEAKVEPIAPTTNWWGAEPHPSDYLIHWSYRRNDEEFFRRVGETRAAWDLIHTSKEFTAAYEYLTSCEQDLAGSIRGEEDAGEDL